MTSGGAGAPTSKLPASEASAGAGDHQHDNIARIAATGTQRAFTVFTADAETGLDDTREYQHATGALQELAAAGHLAFEPVEAFHHLFQTLLHELHRDLGAAVRLFVLQDLHAVQPRR